MKISFALRRIAAVAALATAAVSAGPLVGVALAAPTIAPNGLSPAASAFVQPPTIVTACYTATISPASTITLTKVLNNATVPVPGTSSIGNCGSGTGNRLTFTPQSPLTETTYTATATALDPPPAIPSPTPTTWMFTVDTTGPVLASPSLTSPITAAKITANQVTFTGTATDPALPISVVVKVNDHNANTPEVSASTSVTTSGASFSISLSGVGGLDDDPALTASAILTDAAGNVTTVNGFSAVKDTTGPSLLGNNAGTSPKDNTTVQPRTTVAGVFSEPLDTNASSLAVRNKVNSSVLGSSVPSGSTVTFTASSPFTEAGSPYTATFTVKDLNGNPSTALLHFTIDSTPPAKPSSVVLPDVNLANVGGPSVAGIAEPGSTVTVSVDDATPGVPVVATALAADDGTYNVTMPSVASLDDGDILATVTATDPAGNVGPAETDGAKKDTLRPAIANLALTSPITAAHTTTVSGDTEPNLVVTISLDDNTVGSPIVDTATADGTGHFSKTIDVAALNDPQVHATVYATDALGNQTSPAATASATKDASVPTPPTVVITPQLINQDNVASITISGVTEPGLTVDLTVDDADSGNALQITAHPVANGSGNYTVTKDLSGLTDGVITVTATVTDAVGNVSDPRVVTTSKDTIDPAPPVVSVAPYVHTASLTVNGTSGPNFPIDVSVTDGTHTSTASTVANGAGDWTTPVSISNMSQGLLTVTAFAYDLNGNKSTAGSGSTTKDTVAPAAPSVVLTDPINPGNVGAVTVTGAALASEAGGLVSVTLNDADNATPAQTGTDTIANDGTYSVSFPNAASLSDGTLTATAHVTDLAGNLGPDGTDTAAKDTIALAVASITPANGAVVRGVDVPHVDVVFNEPVKTSTTSMTLSDVTDTQLNGATTFSTDRKTMTFTPSDPLSQPASPYAIAISAHDDAGDAHATSSTFTVDDTIPATPTVTINADHVVNAATAEPITVSGNAESGSSVLVRVLDAALHEVSKTVTASGGTYSAPVNVSTLDDGTLTAKVVSTDPAGNPSSEGTASIAKDTSAPAAPAANLPTVVNAANAAAATISGTAEALSTLAYSVTSDGGAGTVSGTTPVNGTGDWTKGIDVSSLPDGTLTLTVHATDTAGNTGTDGTATTVKDVVVGTPTVAVTDPVNSGNVTQTVVSGVAEKGSSVAVSLDDATVGSPLTGTVTADGVTGAYTKTFDATSLADGVLTATVVVTDTAGNVSSAGTGTATKDVVAPLAATIDSRGAVTHVDRAAAVISGTSEPGASVAVSVSDGSAPPVNATPTADGTGVWTTTLDLTSLADGTLSVTALQTDTHGNAGPLATASLLKNESRAFTLGVSATPVSGAAQAFSVTAHQTFDTASPTDTTYTGTPVLSSLDGHFTPGTCAAAVLGVADCTGTTFGDLGAQSLLAAQGVSPEAVTGTMPVTVQATGIAFTVAPPTIAATGQVLSFTVTPSAANGASIAGYNAVRTIVTTGGSIPANGSALACGSGACTATVSFATPGPKTVTVTDNGTPNRSTATRTITIPYVSSLTLATTRTSVVSGGSVTLFGKLKNASQNLALGGRTVRLYRRTAPATTYSLFASATTASDGSFTKSVTLTRNTAYQAKYTGDTSHKAATSIARGVLALQKVTATYTLSGRTLTITGSVSPLKAGAAIYIVQKRADGSIAFLSKSFVAANGTYRLTKAFSSGKFILEVLTGATSTNAAGHSGYRTVTIP